MASSNINVAVTEYGDALGGDPDLYKQEQETMDSEFPVGGRSIHIGCGGYFKREKGSELYDSALCICGVVARIHVDALTYHQIKKDFEERQANGNAPLLKLVITS